MTQCSPKYFFFRLASISEMKLPIFLLSLFFRLHEFLQPTFVQCTKKLLLHQRAITSISFEWSERFSSLSHFYNLCYAPMSEMLMIPCYQHHRSLKAAHKNLPNSFSNCDDSLEESLVSQPCPSVFFTSSTSIFLATPFLVSP